MRWVLRTLVLGPSNGSYEHLHDLYRNDPNLRRVVRTIQDRLDQNPPVTTDPEELRQMLLNAPGGQNSEYLRSEGNLDNH
ncbi:hypothetical protein L0222_01235 [bacterium]|nr:hypothetical protein [bacterium]MCI0604403.1 hypothetical protein [bacterium]